MKSLRGIRKDSLCLASRSIALVVFFIWSTVACSQLQAEDPLQLLTASHAALGDNESNATIRFARQTGEWQLVAIDFYFAGNNVNLEPVERFNSIEKLDIFMRTDSDPTASLLGIASISKLLRLRELKMSAKDLANGIDLANTLSNSIESLELDGDSSAIDSIMARLSAFPHLKTLKIYGLVTNESFSRIHESKSIQSIEIGSEALTDDAMVALATLHDLRSLDIFWCAHISELGIKKLVPLTKLNDLAVYKVNDKCIAALELLPALEKLSCLFEGEQADLRRLQRLKTFELPEFEDSNTKQPVRILFPVYDSTNIR